MENSTYSKKLKQKSFHGNCGRRTQADKTSIVEEEGKVILDLLLVIYDLEKEKKAFLRFFFFHSMIIFCSSTPRGYRQITS